MMPPSDTIRTQMCAAQRRMDRARKKGHEAPTVAIWSCACRELRQAWAQRDMLADRLAAAISTEDTILEAGGYWPQEARHA